MFLRMYLDDARQMREGAAMVKALLADEKERKRNEKKRSRRWAQKNAPLQRDARQKNHDKNITERGKCQCLRKRRNDYER